MSDKKLARFQEAYLNMAKKLSYRPEYMGDDSDYDDELEARLIKESLICAKRFYDDEEKGTFDIGCSDFDTNRALVYTIEAARCICCGIAGDRMAIKLLKMAIQDIEAAKSGD